MESKKVAKQLNFFSAFDVIPLLDEFDREYELKIQKSSEIMQTTTTEMGYGITTERRMLRSPAVHLVHDALKPRSFEARPYTIQIVKQALKGNSLIILPTGLGKTYAGILLVIETLKINPLGKILFLAPTKPLCEQHEKTLATTLPKLSITQLTGRVNPNKRLTVWQNNQIIVATPETIIEEIRKQSGVGNAADISLLLIDEVHHLTGNYAYAHLADYYLQHNTNILISGFTASPDADISQLEQLQQRLRVPDRQILARTYDSPDVKPYCFIRFIKPIFLSKGLTEQQRRYKSKLISILTRNFKRLEKISGKHLSDYAYHNDAGKVVGIRIKAFNGLMERLQRILSHTENQHERGLAFVDWAMSMKLGNAIDRLHKGMPEFIYFMQKQFDAFHKKATPSNSHFANNVIIREIVTEIITEPIREKLRIELAAILKRLGKLLDNDMSSYIHKNSFGQIAAINESSFEKLRAKLEADLCRKTLNQEPTDNVVKKLIEWSLSSRLQKSLNCLNNKLSMLVQYLCFEYQEYKKDPKPSQRLLMENESVRQVIAWLVHYNLWRGKDHPSDLEQFMDIGGEINWKEAWHDSKLNAIAKFVEDLQKRQMLIFVKYRDTLRKVTRFLEYKFPNITCDRLTGTSSNYGDPGMKQTEQQKVLEKYKSGEIQILVSTSIGEEGLDFPAVDTLIFYEPISDVRRYIQRLGRTARHKHGNVYILIFKDSGEETIYYTSRAEERSVRKIIQYYQNKTQ